MMMVWIQGKAEHFCFDLKVVFFPENAFELLAYATFYPFSFLFLLPKKIEMLGLFCLSSFRNLTLMLNHFPCTYITSLKISREKKKNLSEEHVFA